MILGWSMDEHLRAELVIDALRIDLGPLGRALWSASSLTRSYSGSHPGRLEWLRCDNDRTRR
jgi:hypothetical protein